MARGGKQLGAGRPKGSKTRPQLRNYISEDQIKEFAQFIIDEYRKKPELARWLGDQVFGRAVQPLGNDDGNPLIVEFHKVFKG
jgi:hypothetical protein|tara:strand:+ start:1450 stop:1698 length:249 start_codon:yes stop_codon:yes gene_type:complete